MRIGICDDQKEVREILSEKIKMLYPAGSLAFYNSGQEVLDAVEPPDILFLDIQMPRLDGMETARRLRKDNGQMILIFVTALEDYVFQAFDVGAFHYLVKPFSDEKFYEVLGKAVEQFEGRRTGRNTKKEPPDLMITAKGKHIMVHLEDIVYAEVFDRKVVIHTMDSDIEYYGKMRELEKRAGDGFYRSHRAYLVNFNYIRKYDATAIWLERGQALMAKQNYREFVKAYLRYNKRKGRP